MNLRMLCWPVLACLSVAVAPAHATVSIPRSAPPICDIPEDPLDPADCPIITYSMRDCPDILPSFTDGKSGSSDAPIRQAHRCASPTGPIQVHIECDSGDTVATCRANPSGLPDSAYSWQLFGAIQNVGNDELGPEVTISCTQKDGEGKIRLLVTNPWSGITSEAVTSVDCQPPASVPGDTSRD